MISDNDPILSRYISVPKELSQLNCNAFVAGIVEAVLDGCQFVGVCMVQGLVNMTHVLFYSLHGLRLIQFLSTAFHNVQQC